MIAPLLLALAAAPCTTVSTVEALVEATGSAPCIELAATTFDLTPLVAPVRRQRELKRSATASIFSPQRPGHGAFEGGLTLHDVGPFTLRGGTLHVGAPTATLTIARARDVVIEKLRVDGLLVLRHVEGLTLREVVATRLVLDDVHHARLERVSADVSVEDSSDVRLDAPPRRVSSSRDVSGPRGPLLGGRERERLPGTELVGRLRFDRTEATFADWSACARAGACAPREGPPDLPVTPLSLEEARAFCRWRGGRLPTPSEWVAAARGVDGRPWPWGFAPPTCRRAALTEAHDVFDGPCLLDELHPGCSHPEGNGPYGLCDQVGNAWEWTSDGKLRGGDVRTLEESKAPSPELAAGVRCVRDADVP
ncbi:MAG: formylglycine-generating enzyme family protein [Myxococcota bacterium]